MIIFESQLVSRCVMLEECKLEGVEHVLRMLRQIFLKFLNFARALGHELARDLGHVDGK